MVFGSLEVSKKNGNSNISEFGDSYNVRHTTNLKIDYSGASSAPNHNNILINGNGYLTDDEKAKQIADVYQRWLYENDIYNTGVQYSVDQTNGMINIESNVYNLSKIDWTWDYSDELQSQYLSDVFFNNTSNSFIEVIKYNKSYKTPTDGTNSNPLFTNGTYSSKYYNGQKILTSAGLDLNSASKYNKSDYSNSSNEDYTDLTEGVVVNTVDSQNVLLNDFVALKEDVNRLNPSSSSDESSSKTIPTYASDYKWYVFKDLSKLVKRLNYVQMVCIWNDLLDETSTDNNIDLFDKLTSTNSIPGIMTFPNLSKYEKVTYLQKGLYETLSSDEKTWGDSVAEFVTKRGNILWINDTNILDLYNHVITDITAGVLGNYDVTTSQSEGYFSTSIDNIISPYVIAEITYDNYTEFFPQAKILNDKNPNSNQDASIDINANKLRFSYSSSLFSSITELNETAKNNLCVDYIKENISIAPMYISRKYTSSDSNYSIINVNKSESIHQLTNLSVANDIWKDLTSDLQSYSYPGGKVLENSITGMSAYNSLFLASGIILFMIAIFISVFYRVPGVFGSIAIITSTVLATSLNFIIGLTFSFATTLAIFIGILLGLSSVVILMERIRKNMKEGMSVFDSSDNSIKKSFMQVVDTHVVSIIIGLSLSFLGKGETLDFGFQLILSAGISLLSMFLFFYLYILQFTKEPISWKENLFYHKLAISKNYDNKFIRFTSNFSWKNSLIISSIFLGIFIIVIASVFTLGVQNSITYNEGTSLYIYESLTSSQVNQINNGLGFGWTVISSNSSFTLIQSTIIVDNSKIENVLSQNSISNFIIARSATTIPLFEAKSNMLAVLASSGFVAIYVLIRHGIFAIIPIFVSTIFGLLLGMSFEYIFFLPTNSFYTYISIFIFVLLNIIIISMLNVLRSRFNKKTIFNIEDIKEFFSRNLKNMKNYFIIIMSVLLISSCILMLFSSMSLLFTYLSMLIDGLFAIIVAIVTFNLTYYGFVALRQKYLVNIFHNAIENRSSKYDYIDEELVKGINQF